MILIDPKSGRPVMAADSGDGMSRLAETLNWGYQLSQTPMGISENSGSKALWEAKGWKEFVEHLPESKQPIAAIFLENCRKVHARMDESTRTLNLSSFDKWIFPVISSMVENDVIDQLVAVQPMPGPTSQVVYMDIVTARRKGQVPPGTPFWRSLQGAADRYNDSDELIENEPFAGNIAAGTLSYTVDYAPLRPGTMIVASSNGTTTTTDDANGNILASSDGNITGGTINYSTGTIVVNTVSGLNGSNLTTTYVADSEGSQNTMEYDLQLSSSPVTAKAVKLRTKWTEEAAQNLEAMYAIKAEDTLITGLTNALLYQQHRQVIADLRLKAAAGLVSWDATPPANTSYQTHKFSINDAFTTGSNFIFGATNRVKGNWLLLGLQASTVVETMPQFRQKNNATEADGISYLGDLGNFKCFTDPHYPNNEFLIGYKGDKFFRTGYVLAVYQRLYTTPDIMLPDFQHQRGFASSFAKKIVNALFYSRGLVLNAPSSFGPTIG
jgi:hypothetical protein